MEPPFLTLLDAALDELLEVGSGISYCEVLQLCLWDSWIEQGKSEQEKDRQFLGHTEIQQT